MQRVVRVFRHTVQSTSLRNAMRTSKATGTILLRAQSGSSSSSGAGGSGKDGPDSAFGKAVPDNFYDEAVEDDKEFVDMVSALSGGGLENLVTQIDAVDVKSLEGVGATLSEPEDFAAFGKSDTDDTLGLEDMDEEGMDNSVTGGLVEAMFPSDGSLPDDEVVSDAWERMEKEYPGASNYIIGGDNAEDVPLEGELWDANEPDLPHEKLANFIPKTSRDAFPVGKPGLRACPGKLQRHGKKGTLRCHKIDLDTLSHLDVVTLRTFVTDSAEIMPRSGTGLCSKCQRKVAKTIKRARNYGILPNLDSFSVQDTRPLRPKDQPHHSVVQGGQYMKSRTI